MSPLGFYFQISLKEKIQKGEFIDILSLLPSSKDFLRFNKKLRIKQRKIDGGLSPDLSLTGFRPYVIFLASWAKVS